LAQTTTTPETPKKIVPSQPQPKIEPHSHPTRAVPIPGKPPNVQQALNQFVDRICVPETHSMLNFNYYNEE